MRHSLSALKIQWVNIKTITVYILFLIIFAIFYLIFSYFRVENQSLENISIRLDRAAAAAAAISSARLEGRISIERDEAGLPVAIILHDRLRLASLGSRGDVDDLLREIGTTNQGAASVFRWNAVSGAFDRIATTFRRPDGSAASQGSLEEGNPAFRNMISGQIFKGPVPELGRKRQAYLTPILTSQREVIGILAIDVGWLDDLQLRHNELLRDLGVSSIIFISLIGVFGAYLLRRQLRPLRDIANFSSGVAAGNNNAAVPYVERNDEIGEVAQGLARIVEYQEGLRNRLHTDPTTGIGSRVHFLAALDLAVARAVVGGGACALVMLDLDLFKQINDSLGHQMGDKVLALVARRIADAAGPGSSAARIGGDEFAVVFPYRDIAEVTAMCERLHARVAERTVVVFAGELRLRASIGVALLPRDAITAEIAYRNADLALRASKSGGRNAVTFFSKDLNNASQREADLTRMLHRAIERGEFDLHFQPQVDARTLQVLGCEALLRWKHPVEGFIPPAEFIPVAERNGLISAIGSWVLRTACQNAQDWISAGVELPRVSVNVSAIQLWQPDFLRQVGEALDASGLLGECLCLEITESVFVSHSEEAIRTLIAAIRDLGVMVALDDFGAGYSSLSYLNSLPLDEVKIDRSFISNADQDMRKRRVLAGIVALGKGLGLSIIAEGAETKGEATLLRELECEGIQGYFFSRPLPAEQLPDALADLPGRTERRLAGHHSRCLVAPFRGADLP